MRNATGPGRAVLAPGRGADQAMFRRIGFATIVLLLVGLAALAVARVGQAQDVVFTKEYLRDARRIEVGRRVWVSRCQFCHGKTAYPGKAPKLDPSRYTPEFVYDRVTRGFQGMPSWKHEFSEEERMAVVAYIMSEDFSN